MTKEKFVSVVKSRLGVIVSPNSVTELQNGAICGHETVPVMMCRTTPAHRLMGFEDPRDGVIHLFQS